MKQINNGFKEYYYLTEDGLVYNSSSHKYLKPCRSSYKLQTQDNSMRSITLSALYDKVYGKRLIQDNVERLDGEIFKEIPGTDHKYLISNYGRCISYNQCFKSGEIPRRSCKTSWKICRRDSRLREE